jgi:hypothetical protein
MTLQSESIDGGIILVLMTGAEDMTGGDISEDVRGEKSIGVIVFERFGGAS